MVIRPTRCWLPSTTGAETQLRRSNAASDIWSAGLYRDGFIRIVHHLKLHIRLSRNQCRQRQVANKTLFSSMTQSIGCTVQFATHTQQRSTTSTRDITTRIVITSVFMIAPAESSGYDRAVSTSARSAESIWERTSRDTSSGRFRSTYATSSVSMPSVASAGVSWCHFWHKSILTSVFV